MGITSLGRDLENEIHKKKYANSLIQGLLDLEGSLASVRTHLVKRDQHATDLLDTSNGAEEEMRMYVHDTISWAHAQAVCNYVSAF